MRQGRCEARLWCFSFFLSGFGFGFGFGFLCVILPWVDSFIVSRNIERPFRVRRDLIDHRTCS